MNSTTFPPVEVLIIGAGVAGAVVARHLVEAGMDVLCLERGDWPDRARYPGASDEWELQAGKQWSASPHLRGAPGDYPIDLSVSDVGVLNFNGVGGGSVLYAGQWPRMRPDDFRVRTLDGTADDWPIGYDDLLPYYEETDRQFGVSGLGGNPAYPIGEDPPLPPLPIGEAGLRIARAHARLGWHWWPAPTVIASATYDGRNPCVQRGSCTSGCNEGAKASTDLTHWPRVLALGGRVITGAAARRIVTDASGLACGAEWVDRDGVAHFQPADIVVVAANAIGTARLLLASADSRHPQGLANSSDLVGRNLMVHPLVSVTGVFDEPLRGWRAHAGGLVQCLEFVDSDPARGFVRSANWALGTAGGPLGAAFAPDGRGRWGTAHHEHMRERFGRTASWILIAEDLPEPHNRVDLSPTVVDELGMPAPRLHYRFGENTIRLVQWHIERARESLVAAGARDIDVLHHKANGHFMGTARMGADPATSVVDPFGVAHDVPNLLVVDGSVFVTGGSANPTSTIAAFALRAATQLVARRCEMPRPVLPPGIAATAAPRPPSVPVGSPPVLLNGRERAVLAMVADRLVPATDAMPVAAAVGVADGLVDRVLTARPDLGPGLRDALSRLVDADADDIVDAANAARTRDPLGIVRYVVAAAYYLDPGVRDALDYHPEPATPVRARDFPAYLEEGLLDHLLDTTIGGGQ